jgi:DNA polymerase-3 subunit delta'
VKSEPATIETDKEPGCAHPRETFAYIGHDAQEAALADALEGRRMHHAWLLSGPKGAGKATLAYRFARAALGARRTGPRPLDVDSEAQVSRRVAALSHPDLFVLHRGLNDRGKPRREISVDEARELGRFFSLAPSEGGMRVAIIDAVDDLNRNAANALLKTLEEPPKHSVLLLVCHAPGAALATIRSRCRRLAFRPLSEAEMRVGLGERADDQLLALAKGRLGRAIALRERVEKLSLIDDAARRATTGRAMGGLGALYDTLGGEPADRLEIVMELCGEWARQQALGRHAESWAEAWSSLETLRDEALGLDMDPRHALARAAGILDRAAALA